MPGSLGSHIHRLREVEAERLRRQQSTAVDPISGQTEQLGDVRLRLPCPSGRAVGPSGVLKNLQISIGFESSACLPKSQGLGRVQGCDYQVVQRQISPISYHTECTSDECETEFAGRPFKMCVLRDSRCSFTGIVNVAHFLEASIHPLPLPHI